MRKLQGGHLYRHYSQVPDWLWELSPNFHPRTDRLLASPESGAIYMHPPSMIGLQGIRDDLGPTALSSGYRSPVYNARTKGSSPNSFHSYESIAFDVEIRRHHPRDLIDSARSHGFVGIGVYLGRGFIHIDKGLPRLWFNTENDRKQYNDMYQLDVAL